MSIINSQKFMRNQFSFWPQREPPEGITFSLSARQTLLAKESEEN
jgi:hypothetical protein